MIISVAGNCNAEEIIKVLGKTFGSLEGSTRETVEFERPAYEKNRVQKNYEIDHTYFCLGVQGLKQKDDDRVAMYAISSILGEGMSSRFYKEIREEYGLAYTIYTYYTLYAEAGTFAIAGICSNEDLEQITELILKQIKNLINVTVPQQELDRAKAKLKGNFYINLESVENRMIRLAKLEDWHGRHFTIGDELEMLNAVSATDVQRVSKKLFHDKPWVEAMVMNH